MATLSSALTARMRTSLGCSRTRGLTIYRLLPRSSFSMKISRTAAAALVTVTVPRFYSAAALVQPPSIIVGLGATRSTKPSLASLVPSSPWGVSELSTSRRSSGTRRYNSFFANLFGGNDSSIPNIDKTEMEKIVHQLETDDDSPYVILDVRNQDEVDQTGPLSKKAHTLPLSSVNEGALQWDAAKFQETFGFSQPLKTQTLVFSCAAGKRAQMAAARATQDGFETCLVYGGSANEWFS